MKDGAQTRERDVVGCREAGEWLENRRDGGAPSHETPPVRPGPASAEIHSSTLRKKLPHWLHYPLMEREAPPTLLVPGSYLP